jgi:hypothetical protein
VAAPPADLEAASPYGGTHLGICYRAALEVEATYEEDHAEEYGELVEIYECGQRVRFVAQLRQWNDTTLATLHPATALGAVTGKRGISYPGSFRAGTAASARAVKLLWAPVRYDDQPAIYLPAALPTLARTWTLQVGITRELVQEVWFEATRNAAGCLYQVRHVKDIVL